jgi:hypothetical protein
MSFETLRRIAEHNAKAAKEAIDEEFDRGDLLDADKRDREHIPVKLWRGCKK